MSQHVSKRLVLRFPIPLLDKPMIHHLTIEYSLVFNILKAQIIPNKEGLVVLELTGKKDDLERGLKFLEESNVIIEQLAHDIVRNEETCVHCGLCVAYCPTGALHYEEVEHRVIYDDSACVACEECVRICPTHAFEVTL